MRASPDTLSRRRCNSARRCLAGQLAKGRCPATSRASVREVRHTNCKSGSQVADVGNRAIQSCCPEFRRDTRAAGQRTRAIEKVSHFRAREFAKYAPASNPLMPDAGAPQGARRAIDAAKARPSDRWEGGLAFLFL